MQLAKVVDELVLKGHVDLALEMFAGVQKRAYLATRRDIEDAIQHFIVNMDLPNNSVTKDMFKIRDIPKFKYADETDDDFSSWAEWADDELKDLDDEELYDELVSFRGHNFAKQAMKWIKSGKWPAIVVIQTPNFNEISDGRGRTSVALGLGLKTLPATILSSNKTYGER